jgi:hypothetical protein
MIRLTALALMLLALLCAPSARAAQSYDSCTGFITSLPATINSTGIWCMKQDLSSAISSGTAIAINADDVTIDCNEFKLGGLAAGAGTQTYGIKATNHTNTTIRRCNIRGFYYGIGLLGTGSGHLVEDNRFDSNTFIPMLVRGDNSVVQRNLVFNSGNSTVSNYAYGIYTQGGVDILDNTVSGVVAHAGDNGGAVGIQSETTATRRIIGNAVRGLAKDGAGSAFAIYTPTSDRVSIHDNELVGDQDALSQAIHCQSSNARASDNTLSAFGSDIVICHDSGGNASIP